MRMPTSAEHRAEQLRQPLREELVERVDVGEQARHEVADRPLVEVRQRQRLQLREQPRAQLGEQVLPGGADAPRLRALAERGDDVDAEQDRDRAHQAMSVVADDVVVDGAAHHPRPRRLPDGVEQDEAERRHDDGAMRRAARRRAGAPPRCDCRRACRSCDAMTSIVPCHLMPRLPSSFVASAAGSASRGSRCRCGSPRRAPRACRCATILPSSSTRMRSASRTVEMRCAMTNAVQRESRISRSSAPWIAISVSASTAEVLSSRMSRRGCVSSTRAMAMRCRCPPERPMPRSPMMVS